MLFFDDDMDSQKAMYCLPMDKAVPLQYCVQLFMKVEMYFSVWLFLRLLALMVAFVLMVPWARLFMQPIQFFLNS